jgi:hypothetical protein
MQDQLKVGAASVKITPPLGTPLAGYYNERGAEKIHDDLYAKTLVVENDGTKVAIVSCDLVGIPAYIVEDVRSIVEKSTGIPGSHVMVSATHSHTGPVLPNKNRESDVHKISGKNAPAHEKYLAELPDRIAESVRLANSAMVPGNLCIGLGHEDSISFNRRYYMKDGSVGWNPGKLNPNIVRPAGPIDPGVFVLYAESSEGKPISTYVNFALHFDVVSGKDISADVPFYLSTILGKIKGDGMITQFGQGCSANINHINVKNPVPQKGQKEAERIGTILAGEVIKTYGNLKPLVLNNITVKSETIKLPLPDISPAELAPAKEIISKVGKPDAPKFIEMVNAYKVVDVLNRKGQPFDAEVQVIALGDQCAIVCLPCELFTELGMYIKNRSPYPHTLVVELANGSIGYIPDRKAFIEGNYEPTNSKCAPGSGEMLAEKALQLLNELKSK